MSIGGKYVAFAATTSKQLGMQTLQQAMGTRHWGKNNWVALKHALAECWASSITTRLLASKIEWRGTYSAFISLLKLEKCFGKENMHLWQYSFVSVSYQVSYFCWTYCLNAIYTGTVPLRIISSAKILPLTSSVPTVLTRHTVGCGIYPEPVCIKEITQDEWGNVCEFSYNLVLTSNVTKNVSRHLSDTQFAKDKWSNANSQ